MYNNAFYFCLATIQNVEFELPRRNSAATERNSDMFVLTLRTPGLVGVVTHDDPLGMSEINRLSPNDADGSASTFIAIRNTIKTMAETADRFFHSLDQISYETWSDTKKFCENLFSRDQLRYTLIMLMYFK